MSITKRKRRSTHPRNETQHWRATNARTVSDTCSKHANRARTSLSPKRYSVKGYFPQISQCRRATSLDGLHTAGEPPNVVISGWRIYDNKGHVVEEFEPFFSVGWEYRSPVSEPEQYGRNVAGVRVSTFYDPRGQVP